MGDNVKTRYLMIDGTPMPNNATVTTDHIVTTFTVSVRHLNMLTAEQIKDLIQTKHEVTACSRKAQTIYVK